MFLGHVGVQSDSDSRIGPDAERSLKCRQGTILDILFLKVLCEYKRRYGVIWRGPKAAPGLSCAEPDHEFCWHCIVLCAAGLFEAAKQDGFHPHRFYE